MPEGPSYFSQQLNNLFATVTRPDGKSFTQEEVVQGCEGKLTRVYLWKLRSGQAKNPSFTIACALADFFGVSVASFQLPGGRQEPLEQALQNPLVQQLYARATRLDNQALQAILHVIDAIDRYDQNHSR